MVRKRAWHDNCSGDVRYRHEHALHNIARMHVEYVISGAHKPKEHLTSRNL